MIYRARPTSDQLAAGLAKVSLALRHRSWDTRERGGLHPTQAQILVLLDGTGDGLGVGEVARRLAVTAATASESIGALVAKGLVEKRRAEGDRRAVGVSLTARGRERAATLKGWPDLLAGAIDELDGSERGLLMRALTKMVRTLQERGDISASRMCVTCAHFRPHAHDDGDAPHHCDFVDAPLADDGLRVDCREHSQADARARERLWEVFVRGRPVSDGVCPAGGRGIETSRGSPS